MSQTTCPSLRNDAQVAADSGSTEIPAALDSAIRCIPRSGLVLFPIFRVPEYSELSLRRVFGLESIKDTEGNVIKEAPLPVWANFQQRALDVAILQVNTKTDLKIKLTSIERSKHRRVVALKFTIKTQAVPRARTKQ